MNTTFFAVDANDKPFLSQLAAKLKAEQHPEWEQQYQYYYFTAKRLFSGLAEHKTEELLHNSDIVRQIYHSATQSLRTPAQLREWTVVTVSLLPGQLRPAVTFAFPMVHFAFSATDDMVTITQGPHTFTVKFTAAPNNNVSEISWTVAGEKPAGNKN